MITVYTFENNADYFCKALKSYDAYNEVRENNTRSQQFKKNVKITDARKILKALAEQHLERQGCYN